MLSDPPRWVFFWNGIVLLVYQTLDNMDGKQARTTQSSSPLGMLFDHGVDAINSIFGSANWMIAMMLDPLNDVSLCFVCLFGPYGLFYINTWEEYHTGELIMPIINGTNEGLFSAAVLNFLSCWSGPMLWQQTTVWDNWLIPIFQRIFFLQWLPTNVRHADLLVFLVGFGMVREMGSKVIHVLRTCGFWSPLLRLVPFLTLVACVLAVGYTDLDIWLSMPRTNLHLCAALFVEMATALMLAHITRTKYQVNDRWMLLPLIALTAGVMMGWIRSSFDSASALLVYASSAITYLLFKIAVVIHEISYVLDIWCFDITTPRQKTTREPQKPNGCYDKKVV